MKRAFKRPLGKPSSSPIVLTWIFFTLSRMWRMVFFLMRKILLPRSRPTRSRMLRNKAMMPMFRLPFIFSSLLDFGHNGYVIMTIHPLIMHFFFIFWRILHYLYVCMSCMLQCFAACGSKDRSSWDLRQRRKQDLVGFVWNRELDDIKSSQFWFQPG